MTRFNTSARPATSKEPPPWGVWTMTMAVLGAFFGAPSSSSTPQGREIVR